MKKSTKQSACRALFRMITAGILLFAGSAKAETPVADESQKSNVHGLTAEMNESIGKVQNSMMAMLSNDIRKKIARSVDPVVAEAMQEKVMKERILYKKVHPIMVQKCAEITAPDNATKTNFDEKKNAKPTN